MLVDDIVAAIQAQGGFDVAVSMMYGWANEVHQTAVADSKYLEDGRLLGTTVAGTAVYDMGTDVVEIIDLYLDDLSGSGPQDYQATSPRGLWDLKAGRTALTGSAGGRWARAFGSAGEKRFELWPVPDSSGVQIQALVAVVPAVMTAGMSPVIPADMHGDLVDGAIALGLLRIDERPASASAFQAKFNAMVVKLRRRRVSQAGGQPARPGLWRYDWV